MLPIQYVSKSNKNVLYFELIIVGFLVFAALLNLRRINIVTIIPYFVLGFFVVFIFVLSKRNGKRKVVKYGDGRYEFAEQGISIQTKKVSGFLPYSDIRWINYSHDKNNELIATAAVASQIKLYGFFGYLINQYLNKLFPTSQFIEMQLTDRSYACIPVIPSLIGQVTAILREKVGEPEWKAD